jgi:hypothetical protein
VQILVVVANIQVRSLKTEVEKGSACTVIVRGLIDPKTQAKAGFEVVTFKIHLWIASRLSKGKRVNIPASRRGDGVASAASSAATQTNLSTSHEARARDLFSGLNSLDHGIGSSGDMVVGVVKHRGYCGVPSASCDP